MDKLKKSYLIGLILGDGYLNPNSGVSLEIVHGHLQKSYIEWKANLIGKIFNCNPPKLYYRKSTNCWKLSKGHRYFKILRRWIYQNKKKHFSKKILSYLTPESIAIWWMDDGSHSIDHNKKTGRIAAHNFNLYTMTNEEDTQNIISFFKEKHNIIFYPIKRKLKDGTIVYYIKCRTKMGREFCKLIRPYVLPEFYYKLID